MTAPAAPGDGIRLGYTAVVLAGGRATRLGGVDKPLVEVHGRTMLAAALAAAAGAVRIVVVGTVPVPEGILRTSEEPPHGGPAAGLAAGLAALDVDAPWTLVLASDLPNAERAVPALISAAAADPPEDGVCFHDAQSHPQWMLAMYRTDALRRAVAAVDTTDLSMRRLLAPLTLRPLPGDPADIRDCDTWEDVRAANSVGVPHTPATHPDESREPMTDLEHPQQRWTDWVRDASAAVGVDADLVDIVEIHHLSKEVAHRLERPLAPVSTFILGLALGAAKDDPAQNGRARAAILTSILATLPAEVDADPAS